MYNKILFDKLIKKKNPLISIIIPTRNRGRLIWERAIPSVLAQTYQNWELIIIEDGSKEIKSTKHFAPNKYDDRIKIYHIDKEYHYDPQDKKVEWLVGPVNALNKGLKKAKGDWFARLDDDDEYVPHFLQTALDKCIGLESEFFSASYYEGDRLANPYIIKGRPVGAVQTWLYTGYLKNFKYSKDSWKKKFNKNNDIDLPERMIGAGVIPIYYHEELVIIKPRPGLSCTGSIAYLKEHEND